MSRRIAWEAVARDDLRAIQRRDLRLAGRISAAIERYADHNLGDVLKLAGGGNTYRLRVGDWRVLFTLDDGGQLMAILRILNRRDGYR